MEEVEPVTVTAEDLKKSVYFISAITQKQGNHAMYGRLSSKSDYMGGIFDRWLNTVPEFVIFNKIILPKIKSSQKLSVVTDFYSYNPKEVGIAPDVIGVKQGDKIIPFAKFNEKWIPENNCPQIEVKTYKISQNMVSLRDQNYQDDKYLILAETDFRIDYLVPLLKDDYLSDEIYNDLKMDDSTFIISDSKKLISQTDKLSKNNDDIGSISLLAVTTIEDFKAASTLCESNESIVYFKEFKIAKTVRSIKKRPLKELCMLNKNGLYRFNEEWENWEKNKNIKTKTIDIYISNVDSITVLCKGKTTFTVEINQDNVTFGKFLFKKKGNYRISLQTLDRSANNGVEYFMDKSSIRILEDRKKELIRDISKSIADFG